MLACTQAGIPCSVISGLSCVTSAPTLAGIPLTHRGVAQSVTVVSGHLRPDDPNCTVDWAGLAASAEALVLLMAVGNLPAIAACLLDNGRPPGTSVACIQHATTPRHRVLRCSLAELAAAGTDLKVETPAVIVIGSTVPVLLVDPSQSPGRLTALRSRVAATSRSPRRSGHPLSSESDSAQPALPRGQG